MLTGTKYALMVKWVRYLNYSVPVPFVLSWMQTIVALDTSLHVD